MANGESKDIDYKQCSERKLNRQIERLLNVFIFVKEMCKYLFFTFISYFNHYFNNGAKLKMSSDVILSNVELYKLVSDGQGKSLTSCLRDNEKPNNLNTSNFSPDTLRGITNLRMLFLHLRATAGTGITADIVQENIKGNMLLVLHIRFYKLRIDDYKILIDIEIVIRDDLAMIQNIILRFLDIHSRFKILLPKQAQTIEELKILNTNLKFLAEEISEQMGEINELLLRILYCILIYKYQSTLISENLEEFLKEDFPDIFN